MKMCIRQPHSEVPVQSEGGIHKTEGTVCKSAGIDYKQSEQILKSMRTVYNPYARIKKI